MVTAPYISESNRGRIVEYFRWIAPSAKNGLVIYNAPGIGIALVGAFDRALELDRKSVVALKQGNLNRRN